MNISKLSFKDILRKDACKVREVSSGGILTPVNPFYMVFQRIILLGKLRATARCQSDIQLDWKTGRSYWYGILLYNDQPRAGVTMKKGETNCVGCISF